MARNVQKLNPDIPLQHRNRLTVGDFWAWAYSDLLSNTNRSIFAEFLVGSALGVLDIPRVEWNLCDLFYQDKKIEVKCSAYLQSWPQKALSKVKYDIGQKKSWDPATDTYLVIPERSSDCFVFCLYAERELTNADVLKIDSWEFYVLATNEVNRLFGQQHSIALSRLTAHCQPTSYDEIKRAVDQALDTASP